MMIGLDLELGLAEIRFRSNVFSSKCSGFNSIKICICTTTQEVRIQTFDYRNKRVICSTMLERQIC